MRSERHRYAISVRIHPTAAPASILSRPMKMGTTRSLCPYDAGAAHATGSDNEQRTAMLRDRAESTLTNYANSGITLS
jgi:hypothetical protein